MGLDVKSRGSRERGSKSLKMFRVALLGSKGVGKTSFITRLRTSFFAPKHRQGVCSAKLMRHIILSENKVGKF